MGLMLLIGVGIAGYFLWPVEPQKMADDGRLTVAIPGFSAPGGVSESPTGNALAQAAATELQRRFDARPLAAQVWGPEQLQANGHSAYLGDAEPDRLATLADNTGARLIVYGSINAEQQVTLQFEASVADFEKINEYNELISDRALGQPVPLPDNRKDEGQVKQFC
jgi:hypothetical protein